MILKRGGVVKSMLLVIIPEIDIKERQIKRFQMIIQFFGKAAGFSECFADAMTQSAVIPFNTNHILFADNVIIRSKSNPETLPVIRINRIKSNTQRR